MVPQKFASARNARNILVGVRLLVHVYFYSSVRMLGFLVQVAFWKDPAARKAIKWEDVQNT